MVGDAFHHSNVEEKFVYNRFILYESQFVRYGVDGTVFWANDADIAPEYLLEHGVEYKG